MKKVLLLLLILAIGLESYSQQPPTQLARSSSSVIPVDHNLFTKLRNKIPVYPDTFHALISPDSLGLIIYTISPNTVWYRDTVAGGHKWSRFAFSAENPCYRTLAGGLVTPSESSPGDYDVSPSQYVINCKQYNIDMTTTIDMPPPCDTAMGRYVVFYVDTNEVAGILVGDCDSIGSVIKPQVDSVSQIELTFVMQYTDPQGEMNMVVPNYIHWGDHDKGVTKGKAELRFDSTENQLYVNMPVQELPARTKLSIKGDEDIDGDLWFRISDANNRRMHFGSQFNGSQNDIAQFSWDANRRSLNFGGINSGLNFNLNNGLNYVGVWDYNQSAEPYFGTEQPYIFNVASDRKGVLLPKMNTTQMNNSTAVFSSAPAGLLCFNTDSVAFCYYDGAVWRKIDTDTGGGGGGGGGSGNLKYLVAGINTTVDSTGPVYAVNAGRFGVLNEDYLATEDRTFLLDTHLFLMYGTSSGHTKSLSLLGTETGISINANTPNGSKYSVGSFSSAGFGTNLIASTIRADSIYALGPTVGGMPILYEPTTSSLTSYDVLVYDKSTGAEVRAPVSLFGGSVDFNGTRLVSGGIITWISGYTYNVSPASYYIDNIPYTSPSTNVTLGASDPSDDRIDLFTLTTLGTVAVVAGTPSTPAATPYYDASTNLQIGFATVLAGSTAPTINQEWIYRESTEWTDVSSAGSIVVNSGTSPCVGSVSVDGTNVPNAVYVHFTAPSAPSMSLFQTLTFNIRSKGSWGGNKKLVLQFYNGASPIGLPVVLGNSSFGFVSSNTTDCQIISIPLSSFGGVSGIDGFRITQSNTSGTAGWRIDEIQLQGVTSGGVHERFAWEDNIGTTDRSYNANGHNFSITNGNYISLQSNNDLDIAAGSGDDLGITGGIATIASTSGNLLLNSFAHTNISIGDSLRFLIGASPYAKYTTDTTGYDVLLENRYSGAAVRISPSLLGGGFTLPSLTSGSVIFSNGTTLAQDNSNFFFDNTNDYLGLKTNAPTHTVTLGSTSTGITMHNQTDQTTNYERGRLYWSGSVFNVVTDAGGSGTNRNLNLAAGGKTLVIGGTAVTGQALFTLSTGVANASGLGVGGIFTASSGSNAALALAPTVNQSSTAGYRGIWITPYEQTIGSGSRFLIDAGVNSAASAGGTHTTKFNVDNAGNTNIIGITSALGSLRTNTGNETSSLFVAVGGGDFSTASQLQVLSTNGYNYVRERINASQGLTTSVNGISHIIGEQGFNEGSGTTHPLVSQLAIKPLTVGNGTGTTTNGATLYIEGAAGGTATITNNYAQWTDAGVTRLDEGLVIGGTTMDASSLLDIQSTTKGVLLPRMTAAQRTSISSPLTSLVVWDSDSSAFLVKQASGWKKLAYTSDMQNFANADLTATGNRTHNFGTNTLQINFSNGTLKDSYFLGDVGFAEMYAQVKNNDTTITADIYTNANATNNTKLYFGIFNTGIGGDGNEAGVVAHRNSSYMEILRLFAQDSIYFGRRSGNSNLPYLASTGSLSGYDVLLENTSSGAVVRAATSLFTGVTDLTFTGSASPYTLASSTGTDVTFTAGSNITITRSGNDLTFAATGGGTTETASNGLTKVSNDIQLGGTLSGATVISTGANSLYVSTSTASIAPLQVSATSGYGIQVSTTTGDGLRVVASSGRAAYLAGTGNQALYVTSDTYAASIVTNPSSTNTIQDIAYLYRATSGTAANGIGGALGFYTETNDNSQWESNTIVSKWTNATAASRTSEFYITGVNGASTQTQLALKGTGQLQLPNYTTTSSFTGTAIGYLQFDASGNIITAALPSGSGGLTADSIYFRYTGTTTRNFVSRGAGAVPGYASGTVVNGRNIAIGDSSMKALTSGTHNIADGFSTLRSLTFGSNNIAIGSYALDAWTGGSDAVAIGYESQKSNTGSSSFQNTSVGYGTLRSQTSNNYNSAFGYGALTAATSPSQSTAIGHSSLYTATGPTNATAVGVAAQYQSTGQYNTSIGVNTLRSTTGSANWAGGGEAGRDLAGSYNTLTGYSSGLYMTGDNNTSYGYYSSYYGLSSGGTSIGKYAGYYNEHTNASFFGSESGYTFLEDAATEQDWDATDFAGGDITVGTHGWGSIGDRRLAKYIQGSGSNNLTNGNIYIIEIVSSTKVKVINGFMPDGGTGTGNKFRVQLKYSNSTAIGNNSTFTKSNQIVLGDANVTEVSTTGSMIMTGSSRYLNFGSTAGSSGYGVRDNSGTMQYKDNSGSWTNFSSAGGSTDLTFTGSSSPYTLNSSTGTDVTFTAGTNMTITRSGNDLTFASTGGGGLSGTIASDRILYSADGAVKDTSILLWSRADRVMSITGSTNSGSSAFIETTNSVGNGIKGNASATSKAGVIGTASGSLGYGVYGYATGTDGFALYGLASGSNVAGARVEVIGDGAFYAGQKTVTSTNAWQYGNTRILYTTGTAAAGLGISDMDHIEDAGGTPQMARLTEILWDNATAGSPVAHVSTFVGSGGGDVTEIIRLKGTGVVQLPEYGGGAKTGTATYNLQVDVDGNIIEGALGGGSGLGDPTNATNGVVVRTAANTTIARTIAGTANEITVTDGTGVSANPTISLPSTLSLAGKTMTVQDNNWTMQDNSDNTKKMQFQLSSISASTTRTITVPNADITMARSDAAQTFTGVQTFSSAPVISSITNTGTLTLPTVTSTVTAYKETNTTSNATWSPAGDGRDNFYDLTAQAASVTTVSAPSGTPANHNTLTIRVTSDASNRSITGWDAIYRAGTNLALPTTTTASKTMYIKFIYNSTASKWDLVSVLDGL